MRDLRSLYVRANTCVACHQTVEPDLLNAGHPELVFELDSQSVNQPRHWIESDPWIGPRAWLTGQAVALREMSWALARGQPNESEQARWSALAWLLAKTTDTATMLPKISEAPANPQPSDFAQTQTSADQLARRAAQWNGSEEAVLSLLRAFATTDSDFTGANAPAENLLRRRAERLVLGLERLAAALNANRSVSLPVDDQLKALSQDVRPLNNFDPARFAGHLQDLRNALPR